MGGPVPIILPVLPHFIFRTILGGAFYFSCFKDKKVKALRNLVRDVKELDK